MFRQGCKKYTEDGKGTKREVEGKGKGKGKGKRKGERKRGKKGRKQGGCI